MCVGSRHESLILQIQTSTDAMGRQAMSLRGIAGIRRRVAGRVALCLLDREVVVESCVLFKELLPLKETRAQYDPSSSPNR